MPSPCSPKSDRYRTRAHWHFGRRFFSGQCPPALLCVLVFIFLLAASISYFSVQMDPYFSATDVVYYYEVEDDAQQKVEDDAQQKSLALSLLACLGSLFTCLTVCQARRATP